MASVWTRGLSPCLKCDSNLICGPQDVARLVSSGLGSSWSLCGRGRRVPSSLSRGITPRTLRRLKATRASQQENVLSFQEERRCEHGALSFEAAAVLQASTLGYVGEGVPSSKDERKEARRRRTQQLEELIERAIFNCRFFTIMAVVGSLAGSLLCFFKGSLYIVDSFREYFICQFTGIHTGKVILLLVEAVDVYLIGTVMLIFGMGVYELFISSLEIAGQSCEGKPAVCGSNLFGLFRLRARPKWLEIRSLEELKTKLGHVIVMILLVGMFEKSKKVPVNSGLDLLCFAASILMASGCLFLLNKLHQDGAD